jgi:hypothetical protein
MNRRRHEEQILNRFRQRAFLKPTSEVETAVIGKQWSFQYLRNHGGQIVADTGFAVPTFTAIRRNRLEVVTTRTVIRRI